MAYRTFVDDRGHYWQVWDSHPQVYERRQNDRRKLQIVRKGPERRVADRRSARQTRTQLEGPLANGWLTFESFREKRRIAPIPAHWEELPNSELIALCARANPVARNEETSAA
jgi:hypothetical protein